MVVIVKVKNVSTKINLTGRNFLLLQKQAVDREEISKLDQK